MKMNLLHKHIKQYYALSSVVDSCETVRRQTSCLHRVYTLEEESDIT